jgi:hypothetical protein
MYRPQWASCRTSPDRHPHVGGPDSYAGYLANADGFEVELVADSAST